MCLPFVIDSSEKTKTIIEASSLPIEERLEGFNRSFPTDPEEARHGGINLANKRQILVALGVLDFIDSDGVDGSGSAVRQAESDNVFDGVEDLVT